MRGQRGKGRGVKSGFGDEAASARTVRSSGAACARVGSGCGAKSTERERSESKRARGMVMARDSSTRASKCVWPCERSCARGAAYGSRRPSTRSPCWKRHAAPYFLQHPLASRGWLLQLVVFSRAECARMTPTHFAATVLALSRAALTARWRSGSMRRPLFGVLR